MAFTYAGAKTRQISFPLGGIGSGSIGLAGNGRLIDWEIFNRPNKNSANGFSHFAIRAERGGRVLDTRVLHGDHPAPYIGTGDAEFTGFGFGVHRSALAGVPHFRSCEFVGEFPFATLHFNEDRFPGAVSLTAFNPLIPLNDVNSSIPAAFLRFDVHNTTDEPTTYTIAATLKNPLPRNTVHTLEHNGIITGLKLGSNAFSAESVAFGDVTIATDAEQTSYQRYWYRGAWFDNLGIYWRDVNQPGPFTDREYDDEPDDTQATFDDHGLLAAHVTLAPGEKHEFRFVISWNFPNATNYWNPEKPASTETGTAQARAATWKNYYATLFEDSMGSAAYALDNWHRLYTDTARFKDALFSSTLPPYVLDAISANLATLKSPTVLRLENGAFYGWEGCHSHAGSCEGSCTHVWNYTYALPFLFPALERSMRDLDYAYNMRADGKMDFRLQLPLGRTLKDWHAAADGQLGGVIKTYREWKVSGDDAWLRSNWNAVKKSIEFAWQPTNEDKWDPQKTGVLQGRQHHTLDTELFGPNADSTGFYLAALKAGSEIAAYLGDTDTAQDYAALFERGRKWANQHLFNGEYFYQLIDIHDRRILEPFRDADEKFGSVDAYYWDAEHGEIKHQIAEGCHVDQVIAQWHANLVGLGEIFDREKVQSALRAIYAHNFKKSMREFFNPCRVFALNDEAALVICDWPAGKSKPAVPLTYAEEAMHGFEYQAACHMIQEGLLDEGLEVVKAVRDRYDGEKRNPWNEIECGSNYARSMASYALLIALSGFRFDMTRGQIGFAPIIAEDEFRCLWSLDAAWGTYERSSTAIAVRVLGGALELRSFADSLAERVGAIRCTGKDDIAFSRNGDQLAFDKPVRITTQQSLELALLPA